MTRGYFRLIFYWTPGSEHTHIAFYVFLTQFQQKIFSQSPFEQEMEMCNQKNSLNTI